MTTEMNPYRFGNDLPKRLQSGFFTKLHKIEQEARSNGAWQANRDLDEIAKEYRVTQKDRIMEIEKTEAQKRAELAVKREALHQQLNQIQEELNAVYEERSNKIFEIEMEAHELPEYKTKEQVKNILWQMATKYEQEKSALLVAEYEKKAEKAKA
jgi:hypothetical protein